MSSMVRSTDPIAPARPVASPGSPGPRCRARRRAPTTPWPAARVPRSRRRAAPGPARRRRRSAPPRPAARQALVAGAQRAPDRGAVIRAPRRRLLPERDDPVAVLVRAGGLVRRDDRTAPQVPCDRDLALEVRAGVAHLGCEPADARDEAGREAHDLVRSHADDLGRLDGQPEVARERYSGMLPCLRFGPGSRLVNRVSSAVMTFGRVSTGLMTSSM